MKTGYQGVQECLFAFASVGANRDAGWWLARSIAIVEMAYKH